MCATGVSGVSGISGGYVQLAKKTKLSQGMLVLGDGKNPDQWNLATSW
ncbi:MAG: hypothetical protein QS721_05235 [Candidatus Endonucleobacter sp. (ex Gigantidas childressi)]|nr:hypothetical protein [Candidatus Endonucleobacter sp. (ex Gigantidas childressi)]MDP0561757.1 hypothetical protein [Candidatus Endonucleobacter sp. (ex Gigantidas childressi)]